MLTNGKCEAMNVFDLRTVCDLLIESLLKIP